MKIKTIFLFIFMTAALHVQAETVHLGLRLHYDTGMSHVKKKDLYIVETLYKISRRAPQTEFLISGHTDSVGSYEVNVELSLGRANYLKNLLVSMGMDPARIKTQWFSYDKPIAPNDTAEGRATNRRVVCTVSGLTTLQAVNLAEAANRSESFYAVTDARMIEQIMESQDNNQRLPASNEQETEEERIASEHLEKLRKQAELEERRRRARAERLEKNRMAQEKMRLKFERSARLKQNQRYSLGWMPTDNTMKTKGSTFDSMFITDFNHQIEAKYQYRLGSSSWLGLAGVYKFRSYVIDNNPIYNWDGKVSDLFLMSVIYDYQRSQKLNFGLGLGYSQDNFLMLNGLNVSLQDSSSIDASIRMSYKFLSSSSRSARINLMIENPMVTMNDESYKGKFGYQLGVDLTLNETVAKKHLNLNLVYGQRRFENSSHSQTENFVGLEIKLQSPHWF